MKKIAGSGICTPKGTTIGIKIWAVSFYLLVIQKTLGYYLYVVHRIILIHTVNFNKIFITSFTLSKYQN